MPLFGMIIFLESPNLISLTAFLLSLYSLARTFRKDKEDKKRDKENKSEKIAEKHNEIKVQLRELLDRIDLQLSAVHELENRTKENQHRFNKKAEKYKDTPEFVKISDGLAILDIKISESVRVLSDRRSIVYATFTSTIGKQEFKSALEAINMSGKIIDFEFFVREAEKEIPALKSMMENLSDTLNTMPDWLMLP
jgi:vacuolar-type H+-ATPase subunit I/STV1